MRILSFLSLLLIYLLCTAATCEPALKDSGCIDPNKIDRDASCIQVYEPVCGCDGKTYGNSCMASIAGVTEYTSGECPD